MHMISSEKGFTLVEVLVALTVTALMLTAVYQTVSSASIARERLAVENAQHHMARIVSERIGRELQSLHFVDNDERTRFQGGIGGGDMELLSFTSTASTPLARQPGLPARISYQLVIDPESEQTRYILKRIETSVLSIEDGRAYKLADGLKDVEIQFRKDGNWVNRWDSQSTQSLPEAVALTLTASVDNRENVFRTRWLVGDF